MSRLSLVLLLIVGTMTLATSPVLTDTTTSAPSVDITITVLNTFAPDYPSQILGLDYDEANDRLAFGSANYFDPEVTFCDPDTGAYLAEVAYSSPLLDFGVALDDDASHLYLTEWGDGKLYTWDWSNWSSIDSPTDTQGRGMDYLDGYLWVAHGNNEAVKRFLPDGSGVETYSTPELNDQLSGLTTFPLGSDVGIILTSYYADKFFFYRYDGSSLDFLGSVDIPLWTNSALGLAYSASRDSFYYSYTDGATYTISELDIELAFSSIEETTWGQIKAM